MFPVRIHHVYWSTSRGAHDPHNSWPTDGVMSFVIIIVIVLPNRFYAQRRPRRIINNILYTYYINVLY